MMRLLLILALTVVGISTAPACLNDSVIIEAEEEFQQQYDDADVPIGPVNVASIQSEAELSMPVIAAGAGLVVGVVMVAIALGMVMTRGHAGHGQ